MLLYYLAENIKRLPVMKLKLLFHLSLLILIAFEIYKAFLILPFPGSQESEAVSTAWFLYHYRWYIRVLLIAGIAAGFMQTFATRKWIPIVMLLLASAVIYVTNFMMTAESLFHDVENLAFASPANGKLPMDALVIGVTVNGESKAYPIRYLSFHHQVQDQIGGQNILVTYCDVCRSGIVFNPTVDGKHETFRLVGMDQFNAIFEDYSTGSWWRQVNGVAVTGAQKGKTLPVISSEQLSLEVWSKRHPNGVVMLPDPTYASSYAGESFEKGNDTDPLTRTDTASWKDKSWVVGIEYKGHHKAYDWNQLKKERVIYDTIATQRIVLTIDSADVNFFAYIIPERKTLGIDTDTLFILPQQRFGFGTMEPISSRQLFWHTWKTFYPNTTRYGIK